MKFKEKTVSEWAEQFDYHVHSAGDICIIFDMFDCSEIISARPLI